MYNPALTLALQGTAVAGSRGCEIPDSLRAADQLIVELQKLAGPQPPAPLPDLTSLSPAQIAATLTKVARERRDRDGMRELAEHAVAGAAADYVAGYRANWSAWCSVLADQFDAELVRFLEAGRTAPVGITAATSDDQVTAHRDMLRSVAALDGLVHHRLLLGQPVGEENGGANSLLLVADVPEPPADPAEFNRVWPTVDAFVRTYSTLTGVERWRALVDSDYAPPRLALAGEVTARRAELGNWQRSANLLNTAFGGTQAFLDEAAARPQRVVAGR